MLSLLFHSLKKLTVVNISIIPDLTVTKPDVETQAVNVLAEKKQSNRYTKFSISLNQMKKSIIDSTYIARLTLGIAIIKYFAINRTSSKVSRKA